MRQIKYEGDVWNVVGTGARANGKVYLHLSSTTRSRQQKNGNNPVQICDWVPEELVASAPEALGYNPVAVNKAIEASNRAGRRISGREARAIHALLAGRH